MNNQKTTISDRLKKVYEVLDTNGSKLSILTGIPKPTIYNLEKGKTSNPNKDFIAALEEHAGVNMVWFVTGEGEFFARDRDAPRVSKAKQSQLQEIVNQQGQRINELERFIVSLTMEEKKGMLANFNNLGIKKSLAVIYIDSNQVLFLPRKVAKVIALNSKGDTSGVEAVSA